MGKRGPNDRKEHEDNRRKQKKSNDSKQSDEQPAKQFSLLTEEIAEENSKKQTSEKNSISKNVEESEKKTYESFADRLPNVKKERNRILYRRLTLIISVFTLLMLGAIYYVSPFSKLGNISITGNSAVSTQEIIEHLDAKKGENLWKQFKNRTIYEQQIERQFSRIKKVSITLAGINSFGVKIEEYQVVAMSSKNNLYYPVLENGEILTDELKTPQSDLPIIKDFEEQKTIKELMNVYNELDTQIKQNISEIRYTPTEANKELINLQMKDTNIVVINISEIPIKMVYYQSIVNKMDRPGTIDMEVGIYSTEFSN